MLLRLLFLLLSAGNFPVVMCTCSVRFTNRVTACKKAEKNQRKKQTSLEKTVTTQFIHILKKDTQIIIFFK